MSTAPLIEAHTITLIVSWNDAADNQDSDPLAIFVSPRANLLPWAGILPCASSSSFIVTKSSYFICVPGINDVSPGFSINTLENNCFTTTSICLLLIHCP
ncbi:MAG: hypothetical protein B6229_08140 [Spirochaetaceae bacterium 4572_7]|nr:MAG: hypothetical protein B6229_08140 [Spirochaetaceae bacterium 4572_7]